MTPDQRASRFRDAIASIGWSYAELASRLLTVHGMPIDERRVRRWSTAAYDVPDEVLKWMEGVRKAIDKLEAPRVPVQRQRRRPGEGGGEEE